MAITFGPPVVRDDACKLKEIALDADIHASIIDLNDGFCSMNTSLTAYSQRIKDDITPMLYLYEQYYDLMKETRLIFDQIKNESVDFLTVTKSNSACWLQPLSIFYPVIFDSPFSDSNIEVINNWLRQFFPVKNADGGLNYVEGQKFIVNCYVKDVLVTLNVIDQPSSYCDCETRSGLISLHCRTVITGGWIHCNQGSYNCNTTRNCYPSKNVDCWYESPYIKRNNLAINSADPIPAKQKARSRIQANITMNYSDTREVDIKTLIFTVSNCDWLYRGININL
jgi:hypothetical protein